ncbi:hypothetical protein, partial [Escherichia coli]|uniref:hypothetical protein n=1 Tax=Escherichia coli TaxID=562 RepID=UPI0019532995
RLPNSIALAMGSVKEILGKRNEEFYELEFEVQDPEGAIELFKRLGFKVQGVVKKRRWIYLE